jgi:tagaturonate reductase
MENLPETVLQFGGGRFLRAFVDVFVDQANAEGQNIGRIVVVQSTEGERAQWLNAQAGRYHVLTRGLENGQVIDLAAEVGSVSRALIARTQWDDVLDVAASPTLQYVVSNTTEAGLILDDADQPTDAPPRSFPAKLLQILKHRHDQGGTGLAILPCELIENNGHKLRGLVAEQARRWRYDRPFQLWLYDDCEWLNTLVDRIVTDPPATHPLLETDKLACVAEPYALWAVEDPADTTPLFTHPALHRCADVAPYFLRKVRLLNGAHTALAPPALARGHSLVREAVADPELRAWLERLLFEEIVPTLEGRVDHPEQFARDVLERFANPFLDHKLTDIMKYHQEKIQIRLLPTRDEYRQKFGRDPVLLAACLAV